MLIEIYDWSAFCHIEVVTVAYRQQVLTLVMLCSQELLGMSRSEFYGMPVWKQGNLKKDIGLF